MSSAVRKPMTLDEFLAWEERQELRWEFDGFAPVAMNGGTVAHSTIQRNLTTALTIRLRGGRCRPHGPSLKIEVAGRIRYPDAIVVCSDRFDKAREYGNTDSIQRYIILEQTSQAATVFTRMNGIWASVIVDGDADLEMPEIGISVPLAEFYVDVEFPPEDDNL
jgi:Uma2 family endonuclease